MDDLRTLLHDNTAPSAPAPSPSLVRADLARGRTALRRRRTRRGARGSLMALAAAGVVALVVQGAPGGGPSTTATPPAASSTLAATSLAAYTGKQPVGFTIDKVPTGWGVQVLDVYTLLLAPAEQAGQDAVDENGAMSVADKIYVRTTDLIPDLTGGTRVDVGGSPGRLFRGQSEYRDGPPVASKAKTLYVEQPSGAYLTVQVWDASSWTDAQIAELGASIHPTDATVTNNS